MSKEKVNIINLLYLVNQIVLVNITFLLYSHMKIWKFKIFVNKYNDVVVWIETLPPRARARMDVIIGYLEAEKDWTQTPYFSPLKIYVGISELKIKIRGEQYRPLGCRGLGRNEYTILIGAMEKGNRFVPLNAPELAVERRKDLFAGRGNTLDYRPKSQVVNIRRTEE